MAEMSRIQRVRAVVAGETPDRPPVSFWHHFSPGAASGRAAVDAHLDHLSRYDLDFLKVMNDNPYPTEVKVESAADLRLIPELEGDEAGFGLQLQLIRDLVAELKGKVLLTTTVFNAWAVLRRVVVPRVTTTHRPPTLDISESPVDQRLAEIVAEDRAAVSIALDQIAASLARFAKRCIEAGADGIFVSARDDWVDTDLNGKGTYDEIVRIGDGQIFTAAREGTFNLLHVCGKAKDFEAFADYPVQAINWADRASGPAIKDVVGRIKPAICGGVDNLTTIPNGSPADVEAEVTDALAQAGDRPIMISAGCTYDPDRVPTGNLQAIVRAARRAR